MNLLRLVLAELISLLVDDWLFALLLALWVGLVAALRPHLPSALTAPLLFLGVAVLTLVFVIRQAWRVRSRAAEIDLFPSE